MTKMQTIEKKKIDLSIKRIDGETYVFFQVHPVITNLFKEKSEEIKTSSKWKGLKFYYMPSLTENEDYRDLLSQFSLYDDYGSSLYQDRKFNVAFLRTTGGSGKVLVPDTIPWSVVSQGMNNIIAFLKKYYEEFLKDYSIRGVITFEV